MRVDGDASRVVVLIEYQPLGELGRDLDAGVLVERTGAGHPTIEQPGAWRRARAL